MPPTLAAARITYSGRVSREKPAHRRLVGQIERVDLGEEQVGVAARAQPPHDGRADQALRPGHENPGIGIHGKPYDLLLDGHLVDRHRLEGHILVAATLPVATPSMDQTASMPSTTLPKTA